MQRWRVGTIVSCLGMLLQMSLLVFTIGMLLLLRSLDLAVEVPSFYLTIAFAAIFTAMSLLPIFNSNCPFGTPFAEIWFYSISTLLQFISILRRLLLYRKHTLPVWYHRQRVNVHLPAWLYGESWKARDLHIIEKNSLSAELDVGCLALAHRSMRSDEFSEHVLPYVDALLSGNDRLECVFAWAAQSLDVGKDKLRRMVRDGWTLTGWVDLSAAFSGPIVLHPPSRGLLNQAFGHGPMWLETYRSRLVRAFWHFDARCLCSYESTSFPTTFCARNSWTVI